VIKSGADELLDLKRAEDDKDDEGHLADSTQTIATATTPSTRGKKSRPLAMVYFPVDCQTMGIDTRVNSRFSSPPMLCRDASAAALVYPKMAHACYEVMGNDNDNNKTKSVMGLGTGC